MDAKDALQQGIELAHFVVRAYVGDLSDAELLTRPVPGANHAAWQLGHLITATVHMLEAIGQPAPSLPQGFAEKYTRETADRDEPGQFATKEECLALADQMREASLAAVRNTPDSTLDAPGPEAMRDYAPTVGSVLLLLGSHWLMHAGQFTVLRRKLGRPVLF